jgi:hypothetical protein
LRIFDSGWKKKSNSSSGSIWLAIGAWNSC